MKLAFYQVLHHLPHLWLAMTKFVQLFPDFELLMTTHSLDYRQHSDILL
jgi:hypothetical protein